MNNIKTDFLSFAQLALDVAECDLHDPMQLILLNLKLANLGAVANALIQKHKLEENEPEASEAEEPSECEPDLNAVSAQESYEASYYASRGVK